MKSLLIFLVLSLSVNQAFCQDRKVFKALEQIKGKEFEKVEEIIKTLSQKSDNLCLVYLLHSKLFGSLDYSKYNNDSCFIYFSKSFNELTILEPNLQVEICSNFNLCLISGNSVKDSIALVAFNLYKDEKSIARMKQFNRIYTGTGLINTSNNYIEELSYNQAIESNSTPILKAFLDEFPFSGKCKEITNKIHIIEYERVKQINDKISYQAYLDAYPSSSFNKEIMGRIENIDFENVKFSLDIQQYDQFIQQYPNSAYKSELQTIFEPIAYNQAVSTRNRGLFEDFIVRFPKSNSVKNVMDLICQLDYEQALRENTLISFQEFIKNHPNSKHQNEVVIKIAELFPLVPKLKANGKYCYIDKFTKAVIIPQEFEDAGLFENYRAKVKLNGKYGLIDQYGKTVIPCLYNDVFQLYSNPDYYISTSEYSSGESSITKEGLYNVEGVQLLSPAYNIESYESSYIKVRPFDYIDRGEDEFTFYKLINKRIETYSCQYDDIPYFDENGFAIVTKNLYRDDPYEFPYENSNESQVEFALINKSFTEVIPLSYKFLMPLYENSEFFLFNTGGELNSTFNDVLMPFGGKWGLVNNKGSVIIPAVFDGLESLNPNDSIYKEYLVARRGVNWDDLSNSAGVCGLIDINGNELIPFEYQNISIGIKNHLIVNKGGTLQFTRYNFTFVDGGKSGVIDFSNRSIIPIIYNEIVSAELEGGYIVRKGIIGENAKFGVLSPSNKTVIPITFDYIDCLNGNFQGGGYSVKMGCKFNCENSWGYCYPYQGIEGVFDINGKVIFTVNFTEIYVSRDSNLVVLNTGKIYKDDYDIKVEGKYGLSDVHAKIIIPIKYDEITVASNLIFAKSGNKYQLFSKNGNLLNEKKYDEINELLNDYIFYRIGEKYGLMKPDGSELFPAKFWATKNEYGYEQGIYWEAPLFRLEEGGQVFYANDKGEIFKD